MAELVEQVDVQAPLRAFRVNTRPDEASLSVRQVLDQVRRLLLVTTASASPAIVESSSSWPYEFGTTVPLSGGEWLVTTHPSRAQLWNLGVFDPADVSSADPELESHDVYLRGLLGARRALASSAFLSTQLVGAPQQLVAARRALGSSGLLATQLVAAPESLPLSFGAVNVDPLRAYEGTRQRATESREDALADIKRRLDATKAKYARMSPRDVVSYVTEELGIGQLATARGVGVSPTAVRKWRRGEAARSEHRDQLSRFAAFVQLLTEMGPYDPAGWLDIPLSSESTLTPMDLFAAGRADLVVLHAAKLAEPHETLDAFAHDWRARHPIDPDYDVVTLTDGTRAVVPRRRD